ncbi:MAG: DUF5317 domain-containing protein [Solirubrobacteraceae bacterium]
MILILLAALCVISVPLTAGNLGALAQIELRCLWAAPLALALQVVILTIAPDGNYALHVAVHLGTYALAGLFIWVNRRLPGTLLIAAGTLMNALTITVNGGVMPRWETAQRLAGLSVGSGFHNSAVLVHPNLLLLGDIIPVPAPSGLANVLSIGDCVLFAGALLLLHKTCRREHVEEVLVLAAAPPVSARQANVSGALQWPRCKTPESWTSEQARGPELRCGTQVDQGATAGATGGPGDFACPDRG